MSQRILALFFFLFGLQVISTAQVNNMNTAYRKEWNLADSLMDKGLPKSAAEVARRILKNAQAKKEGAEVIRARFFLMDTDEDVKEGSAADGIRQAEAYIAASQGVEKAIWQSIAAQLYWRRFQANRWKLYGRTAMDETKSDDIDTWDAPAFFRKIGDLYLASLSEKSLLQQTPVEKYAPVIEDGKNTRRLRPTVYDLLAFRAIAFFQNDEKEVTQPADQFQMEGAMWFDDATRFSSVMVKVKNGEALHFKALKLYQEIIAAHLQDAKPDALIDADIQRLSFVHSYSVHTDKDSLYLVALDRLARRYPNTPATAQVLYLIAVQQMGNETPTPRPYRGKSMPGNKVKKERDLPGIKARLQEIVAKYPGSEGAINAGNLIVSLDAPSLNIQTEEVNIPGENIKALISYKNQNKTWLKLYRLPSRIKTNYADNEQLLPQLQQAEPLRSWEQSLPGATDMEQHAAELKVDALPAGAYVLVASSAGDIKAKESIVMASAFQVSAMSFVLQNGNKGFVLDRKTGYPVKGATVKFWSQRYNKKTSRYEPAAAGTAVSAADGSVEMPVTNGNYESRITAITFVSGADTLQVGGYFGSSPQYTDHNEPQVKTFLFTDRAIYRPGQTIYFKGIMLQSSDKGRSNNVIAARSATVTFYDVNDQKLQSLQLTTNEYGSFSGTFTAPEGGITGQMRIEETHGSAYVSVEEYKRPKFYVEFDTLKDSYALDQEVKVKGFAKAYAGNNIDGATVKYRVVRRARFPYYWCYYYWGMPSSPEMEITNGTAVTTADGSFEVSFHTVPDKSVDPKTLPVFSYVVYADITDVNGETRSGNTSVQAGYRSLQISTDIAEESHPEALKQIAIHTENLNGVFIPATVKVSIAPLQFPGFLRKRLWETPDQFLLTEAEFRKAFPLDEYKEESNYMSWEKGKTAYEQTVTTTASGKVAIPEETWYKNGWYVIEISGKDAQGREVMEKKYTHVWAPGRKEPVQKGFVSYTAKDSYEPGETLELWTASGAADHPYLLVNAQQYGGPLAVDRERNPFTLKLTEAHRGGLAFSWAYVSENRVYTDNRRVDIPWSNKDLQLEWATHRDKLQPGAAEQWTLTVKGPKKDKVAAELLAGLYDASLDAFAEHSWDWDKLFPVLYADQRWNGNYGFGVAGSQALRFLEQKTMQSYEKSYDELLGMDAGGGGYNLYTRAYKRSGGDAMGVSGGLNNEVAFAAPAAAAPMEERKAKLQLDEATTRASEEEEKEENTSKIVPRTNLKETAFFMPQMATDAEGNVQLKFTIPEALTEWRLMAFAHTKDWKTGYLEGKVKTQKDLMVVPNLPRFLRQNDNIVISTKISNLSDALLQGKATLELLDATTLQPIALAAFQQRSGDANSAAQQDFKVEKGQSTTANWALHIPESRYTPVVVRITAKAGNFSDGEETTLPVITNRMLVTETLPLPVRGSGERTFVLDKLKNSNSSTLAQHALTVEFTGNPAWYAVQALPYLMEYPYECAEQTFNRYYANALAGHIVAQSPKVEQIFVQWQNKDTAALLSNLQKNEELKSALLEETPWVMEAKEESEQKRRIASLFETHKLAKELSKNLDKLEQMQMGDGSFPWFKGMPGDRYITQYILTGIARLQHLGVNTADNKDAAAIVNKALPYLDRQLQEDYENLVRNKVKLDQQNIGYSEIQYLYMRSFYSSKAVPAATQKAFDYYRKQAAQYWNQFNPYMKGQIALALSRFKDSKTPVQVMASLKETAINKEEMGMYWKDMPDGYWWYEAPIEAQSLLIEAFSEVSKDEVSADAMKVWLLKQKQTQNWKTTKATADACYALLLKGNDWLLNEPVVTIDLGGLKKISSATVKTEAGTGYFKERIEGKEVKPEMGTIKVNVSNTTAQKDGASWGAVYWQYFEDLDKITPAATPLSLKKQLFIERSSDRGPVLTEIREGNELKVGDKVKVRIELRVDRDMEYVHMKDMRAACMEPVDVLSGYRYQGGLGYYESTRDVSTNFFFDRLHKGTYVFEYPVFVSAKGDFSNGITTIQCMYAPEFSSHSEGIRVQVK